MIWIQTVIVACGLIVIFLILRNEYNDGSSLFSSQWFATYGQVVFHATDWTNKWDGTINGHAQATGVYVWTLQFSDKDSGQQYFKRGTTVLIR